MINLKTSGKQFNRNSLLNIYIFLKHVKCTIWIGQLIRNSNVLSDQHKDYVSIWFHNPFASTLPHIDCALM